VVLGNALVEMVTYMDTHPYVGAVGCKLLNADGSVQRSCWKGFPSLAFALVDALYLWKLVPRWRLVQASEISVEDLQEPIEVDHLLGACMMVRQEVVEQVGELDPGYFLFLEETDWCYRIQQAGYRIHYVPTAQIIHYGEQSVRKNPERSLPELYRSYCRFCRKLHHFGWGKMQLLKAIIAVAASLRVGLWAWRFWRGDRSLSRRMINGYLRVLAKIPEF
jgi:GT2 family glycosyltransferase